jgi:hypothetical protein
MAIGRQSQGQWFPGRAAIQSGFQERPAVAIASARQAPIHPADGAAQATSPQDIPCGCTPGGLAEPFEQRARAAGTPACLDPAQGNEDTGELQERCR